MRVLSVLAVALVLSLDIAAGVRAVELPRVQVPGYSENLKLSAEEMSFAAGRSRISFYSATLNAERTVAARVPESPAVISSTRRMARQVSGYLEYMIAQAQGRIFPTQTDEQTLPNSQPQQALAPSSLGRRGGSSSSGSSQEELANGQGSTVVQATQLSVTTGTPQLPAPAPVSAQEFSPASSPGPAPGGAPLQPSAAVVLEQLDDVSVFLQDAYSKVQEIWACHRGIKTTERQVDKIVKLVLAADYVHARNKVRWARQGIEFCQVALASNKTVDADHGQDELQTADDMLAATLAALVVLANDQVIAHALSGSPLDHMIVEDGDSWQVSVEKNNYHLIFDTPNSAGARLKSQQTFSSGMVSARIKCPGGNLTNGINTAFYLATDADDENRQSITMEFPGNDRTVVSLNTVGGGENGWSVLTQLGYDCSEDFHTYTIAWAGDRIMWKSDNSVLRVAERSFNISIPSAPMHLYLSLSSQSTVALESWPMLVNVSHGPLISSFLQVGIQTPLAEVPNLPTVAPKSAMVPIGVDYGYSNAAFYGNQNKLSITFDSSGVGVRFHSAVNYPSGEFTTRMRCPAGNTSGLLTSFYLSSYEGIGTQDEIDFEWLGQNKTGVQTNFYVNGTSMSTVYFELGFDCSAAFHSYTIRYTNESIKWFVDGDLLRQVWAELEPVYPVKPVFVYGSIWNASLVYNGGWTGNWSGIDAPYRADYEDILVTSPWREPILV